MLLTFALNDFTVVCVFIDCTFAWGGSTIIGLMMSLVEPCPALLQEVHTKVKSNYRNKRNMKYRGRLADPLHPCSECYTTIGSPICNSATPKEFRWPVCTDWRLGWYRMLPMPVAIQSCECCLVVVDWYSMLCHTQLNHIPAWSVQWPGTASEVSPPHFKWVTTGIQSLSALCL